MSTQLTNEFVNESVSWGTMRDADLYSSFWNFLVTYDNDTAMKIQEEYKDVMEAMDNEGYDIGAAYVKDSEYLIEALFDALNEIAPDGCYFGASEGDGSDYGFWQVEEDYIEE